MTKKNPKVDAFLARAKVWRDEMEALRELVLDCGLAEEIKWGKPCYTHQGGNVAILQPFKPHLALMFFKGTLMRDPEGILVSQGAHSQAAKRLEIKSVEQVATMADVVRAYVREAIELEKSGVKVDFDAKAKLVFPEELTNRMHADPDFAAAFRALTPGRQRAYNLHFSAPKQSKTRAARIEKCLPNILEGRGLNDSRIGGR